MPPTRRRTCLRSTRRASHGAPYLGWFGTWQIVTPGGDHPDLPAGFRLTCYYYRRAYYRSWWLSPPACAVAGPRRRYTGETRFPLLGQNVHRYFFYVALVFNVILTLGTRSSRSISAGT
jgi:hypothetical protein